MLQFGRLESNPERNIVCRLAQSASDERDRGILDLQHSLIHPVITKVHLRLP